MDNNKELEMVEFAKPEIDTQSDYKVYKRRYLMAIFFAFSTICSSMMFATCNPIASQLSAIYHIPTFIVSLASNGFLMMHPILTFVQTFIVNQSNVAVSLKIGCLLTLLGALIRVTTAFNGRFYTIIMGSLIGGIGRPFIINIQANVANDWFKPEDKTTVMMAFSFVITCSSVFGVIIPGQVFKGYEYDLDENNEGKHLTTQLMLLELELFSFILIPAMMFFQAKPPTPSGPQNKGKDHFTYWQSLKITANNKSFLLLLVCYSLMMGGFHALAATISFIFHPFGYTASQISYIQSAPIVCGFASSVTYSLLIKKYHLNLQKVVMFNMVPIIISFAVAYFAIASQELLIVMTCYALIGFFVIPCIPLQLELACEVLYPIDQTIAVGFLLAGVHIWSFVFGEFLSFVTYQETQKQSFYGCMILLLSFIVAGICFSQVKSPKKDNMVEDTENENQGGGI